MIKYLLLFLLCFSCNPKESALIHNDMIELGTVNINGETCNIEEVVNIKSLQPRFGPVRNIKTPLVRRIICPSGNNGQSTVTDDGIKFHREVLE